MKLRWWLIGYGMAMLLVLAAPFASSNPDGLEHVAEEKGFASDAEEAPYTVIADYLFPGVESETLATVLADLQARLLAWLVGSSGTALFPIGRSLVALPPWDSLPSPERGR